MARWDPGTKERLTAAALDLYAEHGYDNVTVTQIAARAGITRRSYFRYFPDKREVLFDGSERLPPALRDAVLAAGDTESPLTTALSALADVGTQLAGQVTPSPQRRAVINASTDLTERDRTKQAAITMAIADALEQRGVEPRSAKIAAQVATIVFLAAFDDWVDGRGRREFTTCLQAAFDSVRKVVG